MLVALIGRAELRGSPLGALRSQPFLSFVLYLGLVIVPVSLYFTIFHGDWYLLYLTDASAWLGVLSLLGVLSELSIGVLGFLLGATFVRSRREPWAGALVGIVTSLAVAAVPLSARRLSVIGTYAQFHGDFGLAPIGGALLQSIVWMSLWTLLGLCLVAYHLVGGLRRA